ncbi:TPA: 3-deoxy-7-phosphoheptulonate synthase [Candidatus Gastranaerophilales bacterium HUM_9]|nr:MAG TPA: 3-deoxy-7-phosphoheptulonate synthase [Candidatus Gastranaerophilales bacterium HUM_9]HBX34416.1 3-deoxy-7-phosphoheptulonate synthase [Cyanobacteria bacterium UBA11440]
MIIIMEPGATKEQINKVVEHLESLDFKININYGEVLTVIAAIGDKRLVQPHSLNSFDGVKAVKIIQDPFKMASRESQKEDTVIEFANGVKIGGKNRPVVIAGPCSVEENIDGLLEVAYAAKEMGAQFLRGGAFKPRTSPYDFQGLEEKGLQYLATAREKTGLLVVTEVMDTLDLPLVCDYADVIQVGARNMQNFKLLKAIGKCNTPVILKRGPAAGIKEFLLAAEHIMYNGNTNVILCERGIKGFDSGYTRNVLDLAAVGVIKKYSHLPIIVDPSHATGQRYLIEPMSKAAIVAGADGIMMEVHNNPDKAYSDGAQSLTIPQFKTLMKHLDRLIDVLEEQECSL